MLKNLILGVLTTVLAVFGLFVPTVGATAGSPAGNNGTVKINNELAPDEIPNNHPHVGCTFTVEFYNYEKGDYNAEVHFALQSPTVDGRTLTVKSGNLKPFIGADAAGGGTDLDASERYTLGFTGDPHPQQGYHVKVTVNAPKSNGSDRKQKVFWVKPCAETVAQNTENENESNPQVLGKSTTQMPEILPETGNEITPILAAGLTTSAIAYTAHSRRSKRSV